MQYGHYFMSRVIKLGQLDQDKLMRALVESVALKIGKFAWIITDIVDGRDQALPFVFGKLSKFDVEGQVTVVDTTHKRQVEALERNLLLASSPFVYLPAFSGLVFLHVWNEIQDDVFPRRLKTLIEAKYDGFFVECEIEPVSDYGSFVSKLSAIDKVSEISATVHPPNPLFGRLWKPLDDYVRSRAASEVSIREKQEQGGRGLQTDLVGLITELLKNPDYQPVTLPAIGDAAVLMAADGYGRGKVEGYSGNELVVVRTSDSQKSFSFPKDPAPEALAEEAYKHFTKISTERDMRHP
jgi:hypothetical protein